MVERWRISALLGFPDYTSTMHRLVPAITLICSFSVAAIEPPTEEELAGAEEAPLEFGEIVVTGSRSWCFALPQPAINRIRLLAWR